MISLDAFARYVYQYTAPATTEHLQRTVWDPLRLSATTSHASLYAVPPTTTNIRCVGRDITARLAALLAASPGSHTTSSTPVNADAAAAMECAEARRLLKPALLSSIGLPFCLSLAPPASQLTPWPPTPCFGTPATPAATESEGEGAASTQDAHAAESASVASTSGPRRPLVVVVDTGAAEAVLRGSDLYAPGIVTASRPFYVGEAALVAFYVQHVTADNTGVDQSSCAALPPRVVSALPTGVTLAPELFESLDTAAAAAATAADADAQLRRTLASRSSFLVCVGSGVLVMEWKAVMSRAAHGTALQMRWTPYGQPSRSTLRAFLTLQREPSPATAGVAKEAEGGSEKATDVFFLQNYSSMVPVALLVDHLAPTVFHRDSSDGPRRCTVLDACAAPGGKTSLLLSLLQERVARDAGATAAAAASATVAEDEGFRVVCCERSRPRQEQLVRLLHHHFATDTTDPATAPYVSRVLEAHCIDTNKFLKRQLAEAGSAAGVAVTHTSTYDAVLLDPPCTGMGLRPRLLPHAQTAASIAQSADYQRKLFDSCVRHIRGTPAAPGVLVYSTCTITLEENEANVLHFLARYPSIRLARATTPAQRALCSLSAVRAGGDGGSDAAREAPCTCLLGAEIAAAQEERERAHGAATTAAERRGASPLLVLRFMPRPVDAYDDAVEDGVAFFVAVFLCCGAVDA